MEQLANEHVHRSFGLRCQRNFDLSFRHSSFSHIVVKIWLIDKANLRSHIMDKIRSIGLGHQK